MGVATAIGVVAMCCFCCFESRWKLFVQPWLNSEVSWCGGGMSFGMSFYFLGWVFFFRMSFWKNSSENSFFIRKTHPNRATYLFLSLISVNSDVFDRANVRHNVSENSALVTILDSCRKEVEKIFGTIRGFDVGIIVGNEYKFEMNKQKSSNQ